MRIAVIGTGYVGLVSGACFSEFGHSVVCVDTDSGKIEALRGGRVPIYEPGLEDLIATNARAGRLRFEVDTAGPVTQADVVLIAVGTPGRRGDDGADLSHVFAAVGDLAPALSGYTLVVTKSTVPVGTGREVERVVRAAAPGADFDVASNPEFLREGSAIQDFLRPDRVVVGTHSNRARSVLRDLYRPLYLNETPILVTSLETAELTKYASNAFLATKITFINEIADLCEATGADVQAVARGMGLDGRIGRKFLHAGPGYGGSCFPKDTQALVDQARKFGARTRIVEAVLTVNKERKAQLAARAVAACGGSVRGKCLAVLGLTFKPNTDDMREAPSLVLIPDLQRDGAAIRAYDPEGMEEAKKHVSNVNWCADAYEAVAGADAAVILTEWNEFRSLDLDRVRTLMTEPRIIDLRNIYRPEEMAAARFSYSSVGRGPVHAP